MSAQTKLTREQTSFVTDEGLLSFLFLFPGMAQDSFNPGSKAYKCEWGGDVTQNSSIVNAISLVAWANDTSKDYQYDSYGRAIAEIPGWHKHVFGRKGRLRMLHETDRQVEKYPYYQGKYVLTLSQTHTAASLLKQKDADVNNPATRANFEMALNAAAPGAYRFPNLGDPMDIQRIHQLNQERMMKQLQPYPEHKFREVMIPLRPDEIWAGCYGRIAGRAYWNRNAKPATVHLALDFVLMTRQGDRIAGGTASPDERFAEYAPAAELAPPGMAFHMQPPPQMHNASGWPVAPQQQYAAPQQAPMPSWLDQVR